MTFLNRRPLRRLLVKMTSQPPKRAVDYAIDRYVLVYDYLVYDYLVYDYLVYDY